MLVSSGGLQRVRRQSSDEHVMPQRACKGEFWRRRTSHVVLNTLPSVSTTITPSTPYAWQSVNLLDN